MACFLCKSAEGGEQREGTTTVAKGMGKGGERKEGGKEGSKGIKEGKERGQGTVRMFLGCMTFCLRGSSSGQTPSPYNPGTREAKASLAHLERPIR